MNLNVFAGGIVRGLQGLAWCAPTLIVGLLLAGLFRYYLGREGTKRIFGGDSWRSLPQSWLWGMLLPVCSIGVIPILGELRRAGLRRGALSAFALSAPLFNPLSLLYGLTLSRPFVILSFAGMSLLMVTVLGVLWDRLGRQQPVPPDVDPDEDVIGIRRLVAVGRYICREICGQTLGYALVALLGLVILGIIFPHGDLQTSAEQTDVWAPLRMTLVAVPIYATPMLTMSQLGMMFQHANSPGAALALLLLGTGVNLGTLLWMGIHFRFRSTAIWFASLLALVVVASYSVEKPLIPPGVEPAGHTHAFDIYTNPFQSNIPLDFQTFRETITKHAGLAEFFSLGVATILLIVGLTLRFTERNRLQKWIRSGAPRHEHRGWDIIIPGPVLGLAAIVGLVIASIVGCFAYYPEPREAFEELRVARVETLSGATSGNYRHAAAFLQQWDDWSRKLEVGQFLRTGKVSPYQRMQGFLLRKKLELLEHEMEESPPDKAAVDKLVKELMNTSRRLHNSYRQSLP